MPGFEQAFKKLIGHEGGYVNDPRDPGGETKYGISKRSYPNVDIRRLTLDGAKRIYRRDFWDRVHGDHLPYPVAFNLFDGAVNSGPAQSIRWMQRAAGVADDGIIGPNTLAAWAAADPNGLAARFNGHRLMFYTRLKGWRYYSKGWARRAAQNLLAVPLDVRPDEPDSTRNEYAQWLEAMPEEVIEWMAAKP